MQLSAIVFFCLLSLIYGGVPPEDYKCSLCISAVEEALQFPVLLSSNLKRICSQIFPLDKAGYCSVLKDQTVSVVDSNARKTCQKEMYCPANPEPWRIQAIADGLDIRVSKAMGSRGYNKLRVSVLSNHSITSDIFSYSEPFKYRWTSNSLNGDLFLNTGILTVDTGKKSSVTIEGQKIDLFVPNENDATRGVILADPCFTSEWIVCVYQDKFDTFKRLTSLLNAITVFDDIHFYQILGDNFYDQTGDATATWHSSLSTVTKSKMFATVPGNHDFWVHGSPDLWVSKDQQGNGFMQYYGQDVVASTTPGAVAPYDFSNDPDGANKGRHNLPPASDFFFYNKVGNIAMIGFSGAHTFDSQTALFDEACTWAQESNPAVVLLLTHWNSDGMGCDATATAPAVYKELASRSTCAPLADKMRYFMGHSHCNEVTETDVGFMVGALGMSDSKCSGQFGFSVVDTSDNAFKVYYFPVQEISKFDNYDALMACIQAKGVSGCYDMATLWSFKQL